MFKAVFMAPERESVPQQVEGLGSEDASHPKTVLHDSLVHQKEGVVRLSLLPVRINLDQDTMFFLQEFFLDTSLAPPPPCLQVVTGMLPPCWWAKCCVCLLQAVLAGPPYRSPSAGPCGRGGPWGAVHQELCLLP